MAAIPLTAALALLGALVLAALVYLALLPVAQGLAGIG
jgi:hypothetical protein